MYHCILSYDAQKFQLVIIFHCWNVTILVLGDVSTTKSTFKFRKVVIFTQFRGWILELLLTSCMVFPLSCRVSWSEISKYSKPVTPRRNLAQAEFLVSWLISDDVSCMEAEMNAQTGTRTGTENDNSLEFKGVFGCWDISKYPNREVLGTVLEALLHHSWWPRQVS